MLQDQPNSTAFLGSVGADEFGEKISACAKNDGVETHYFVDPKTPTGTCAVLVNGENRSMVANLSAANNFDPAHLSTDKAKEMIESARYFYIAGFFLTVSVDAILEVAKHATENRKVCMRNKGCRLCILCAILMVLLSQIRRGLLFEVVWSDDNAPCSIVQHTSSW